MEQDDKEQGGIGERYREEKRKTRKPAKVRTG